jgi:succinoglycan biosynthesis protein ExoM
MGPAHKRINVCICTFRRPVLLKRLLGELEQQQTDGQFTYSVVVADNDNEKSAQPVVAEFKAKSRVEVTYCSEPRQNIAMARNKAVENASGDFIAFIDDDEFPDRNWLLKLLEACEHYQTAGVLGPVLPHFDEPPPRWIINGHFCDRPEHPTGQVMSWEGCRTGNVLFRRSILERVSQPFNPKFDTAGEDMDFFRRMMQQGHKFIWCHEAVVREIVPASRWTRKFMIKRAFLRGGNFLKHPQGRVRALLTSTFAVPVYTVMLPFVHHRFMKVLIRWCYHSARLLSLLGFKLVKQREM